MRLKNKWWLIVVGLLVGVSIAGLNVQADDAPTTNVTSQTQSYGPSYWSGFDGGAPSKVNDGNYPTISTILANHTAKDRSGNNVITNKTTQLSVTYVGSTFKFVDSVYISELYLDIAYGKSDNGRSTTLVTGTAQKSLTKGGTSVTVPSTTIVYDVDFSNLKNNVPIVIAMQLTTTSGGSATGPGTYALARLYAPALKPTITTTGTTTGTLKSSDTTITGTGTPGSTITSNFNDATATIDDSGKYTLDLGKSLSGTTSVTITETNDAIGATSVTATATVEAAPLTLTVPNKSITLTASDLDDLSSDADALAWVLKQSEATAKNPDNTSETVSVVTDQTGLLKTLQGLAADGTTTVELYGKNSAGSKSDPQTVTITKNAGTLKFGTVSSLAFGTMKVPAAETLVQGKDLTVEVADTRAKDSTWTLTAKMAPVMTSTTNSAHTLDLIYRDGTTKTVLSTDQSTQIATGTKTSGVTTTNVGTANNWSTTKGIFLDVPPSVATESYAGTIQWTLTDAP